MGLVHIRAIGAGCLLLALAGCDPGSGLFDAGPDAPAADLGAVDSGAHDLGAPDLGSRDLGSPELGAPELGLPDSGPLDSGPPDLGPLDAGPGTGCTPEVCNHLDDDCNGLIDDGVTVTCWRDADHDGYAPATAELVVDCFCGEGLTAIAPGASPDCDDADARRSPARAEVCNGIDDDCDGAIDDVTTASWYADCDGDLDGAGPATASCTMPVLPPASCPSAGWSSDAADCDDANPARHPGSAEACNGIDDDCDGTTDGAAAAAWCTARAPAHVAYAGCAAAACTVAACSPGYHDCDGGADCELDCTTCGDACPWTCAGTSCDEVTSVIVGNNHSCAVRASGHLDCWGQNSGGQLGDGTTTDRRVPTRVAGLSDVVEVAGGGVHTCALRRSGTVVCWGTNDMLQLGASGPTLTAPGADVPGLIGVTHLSAAEAHTCAITASGSVTCWGEGLAPTVVAGLPPVSAIDTGSMMTCAIRSADSVAMCWGRGALGDGTYYAATTAPVVVGGATPLVARDLGVGTITTCAVDSTGTPWCWGSNLNAMLGDGLTMHADSCGGVDCALHPVQVSGITTATEIALGWHTGCVHLTSGQIQCWGFNGAWCLGTGASMAAVAPTAVDSGVSDATTVTGKDFHFCSRRAAGALSCWGLNLYGELGDGTIAARSVPVAVMSRP